MIEVFCNVCQYNCNFDFHMTVSLDHPSLRSYRRLCYYALSRNLAHAAALARDLCAFARPLADCLSVHLVVVWSPVYPADSSLVGKILIKIEQILIIVYFWISLLPHCLSHSNVAHLHAVAHTWTHLGHIMQVLISQWINDFGWLIEIALSRCD